MDYLYIIAGIAFLILGANALINGATDIARRFNVSDMIIGLTIVAFGTSLPELVVTLSASLNNSADIALSNVVGSNTVNTFLILGSSALFLAIKSDKPTRRLYLPLSLLAPIILALLFWLGKGTISYYSGLVLLLFFSFFLYSTVVRPIQKRKNGKPATEKIEKKRKPKKIWVSIVFIIIGLGLLTIGGNIVVKSAINIAKSWGISEAIIGLTVVAIGTSLPELATSLVAAIKKNSDIALGNIVGSNIFNLFLVLGLSTLIKPIRVYEGLMTDLSMVALGSLLVLIFVYTSKRRELVRWQGIFLLLLYFSYLFYLVSTAKI